VGAAATVRTFVALTPPVEVAEAIDALRHRWAPQPVGLRWVAAAHAHLTLAFLGDLDDAAFADVVAGARRTASAATPFAATLAGVGAFPRPERARVAWLGCGAGAAEVAALRGALAAAWGWAPDPAPFRPHVTIARARHPLDLRGWLAAAPPWSAPAWRVGAVDVVASELAPTGAVHTLVARCPFGAG
jgi:RNA 2',3'-cyclic 3'-phosphodiesterase